MAHGSGDERITASTVLSRLFSSENGGEYDLELDPSVETLEDEYRGFEFSTFGRVNPGEELAVTATFPEYDEKYAIEIWDVKPNAWKLRQPIADAGTETFDTDGLPPRLYIVLLKHSEEDDDDEARAAMPLTVQAYEVTVDAPDVLEPDRTVEVTADLDPLPEADDVDLRDVQLVAWNAENQVTVDMDEGDGYTYSVELSEPLDPPFHLQVSALILADSDEFDIEFEPVGLSETHTVDELPETLTVQKTAALGDAVGPAQFATPAVDGDHAYVGGLGTRPDTTPVLALSRTDSWDGDVAPVWSFDRAGSLSDSSPAIHDGLGLVYVGSGGGILYALECETDDETGSLDWQFPANKADADSAITADPVVDGSTVYVGTNAGTVYALDAASGEKQWQTTVPGPVYAGVAVSDARDSVFVTTADGTLVALDDDDTGEELWQQSVPGEFGSSRPVVEDDVVYAAAGNVHAFDADDGAAVWDDPYDYGGTAGSTPLVADAVYVASVDGHVHALDIADGSKQWTYELTDGVASSPTLVDGRVCLATLDGRCYLLDGDDGSPRAVADVDARVRSSPVIFEKAVYLGTSDGHLVELEFDGLGE